MRMPFMVEPYLPYCKLRNHEFHACPLVEAASSPHLRKVLQATKNIAPELGHHSFVSSIVVASVIISIVLWLPVLECRNSSLCFLFVSEKQVILLLKLASLFWAVILTDQQRMWYVIYCSCMENDWWQIVILSYAQFNSIFYPQTSHLMHRGVLSWEGLGKILSYVKCILC